MMKLEPMKALDTTASTNPFKLLEYMDAFIRQQQLKNKTFAINKIDVVGDGGDDGLDPEQTATAIALALSRMREREREEQGRNSKRLSN